MGYRVFVRDNPDRDGKMPLVGEVDTWVKLNFNIAFNAPGHWQLLVRVGTPHERLFRQGRGIVIFQDGVEDPIFSGMIDGFERYWTNDQHTGTGSVYIQGKDDNQVPHNYLAFPATDEKSKDKIQLLSVDRQWEGMSHRPAAGTVGAAIWQECDLAFGSRSVKNRGLAYVDVGDAPEGVGEEIKDSLRYDNLGSKFAEWLKEKDISYRFLYDPASQKVRLKITKCRDLGRKVRFSPELGNVKQYAWQLHAPKVTRAIVACQGQGQERYIYQAADHASEYAWGRIAERVIDRRDIPLKTIRGHPELVVKKNQDGTLDLGTGPNGKPWPGNTYADKKDAAVKHYLGVVREAARNALKEGEKSGHFQIYPIDTPQCMYGVHYMIGDIVTVEADERKITDKVNEVSISIGEGSSSGEVTPKIGKQGTGHPLNLYRLVSDMREQIRLLEARV